MHRIENLLVFTSVLAFDDVFMPDNAAIHSVALKIESVYPGIWIDNQSFVSSVIEVIPEESS